MARRTKNDEIAELKRTIAVLAGLADRSRAPFELLQQAIGQAAPVNDWVELANGGDNRAGTFEGMDNCPCRRTYTCATDTIALNAWPNPNPNPINQFPWNAPKPKAEPWDCPGDCVVVCTRIWRGWSVWKDTTTGNIQLNINTFAQYHCKKPDDPANDKAPQGGELPPRPQP